MSRRNSDPKNDFVFGALGGIGEIGMNLYLYGFGPPRDREWLIVDIGITFPTDAEPGVDVILPDIRFLEEERHNIAGILLTHAHEDHYGAIPDLWEKIGAPVYATPFTAAMLKSKLKETSFADEVPIHIVPLGGHRKIGPFDIELVSMSHSIPEPNAVFIKTPLGNVLHTGDWKLDEQPLTSPPTDRDRLREIGEAGVDTLICDSTNAIREGISPSEADVAKTLAAMIREAPRRVAVTTFASNVARILSVARAARQAGRELVVVGRAMYRVIEAAQETGYLDDDFRFVSETEFDSLPPKKVVALCTGSQGEPRAAMARIAQDSHPNVSLDAGDQVIFSSRTIPGNERAVARVQNGLSDKAIEIITDQDGLVHVSGHPRRGELEQLYSWLKPKRAIPVHGEGLHLEAHAEFAEELGVEQVLRIRNGDLVRLAPEPAKIIDELPTGRLYRDGRIILSEGEGHVRERRKLSFVGTISLSVVLSDRGEILTDPMVAILGVPVADADGEPMEDIAIDAAIGALESIPRPRRKDRAMVAEALSRAVRAAVNQAVGKKPICSVMVQVV
ncbi:putative ribonuclease J [Methyloligella halotolerans]|uniref:Putative ribonuclease J n=1 Tax=Methyloligella halotolerans TaxID=1177755 RepID=A0A1E2S237_9HYPH|nr:ribonuclease J [Methyloligella halotolerans]ODA68504.1 putative ribonuclease J [Methyloligella halotolerans]